MRINFNSEADEDPLAALRRVVTSVVQHPSADAVGSEDEWRRQEQLFQSCHEHGTAVTHSEISESSQSSLWSQSALSGTQSSGQSPIKITPVKLEPKPSGSLAGIIMRPSVTEEEIDTFAGLLPSAVRTKLKRKKQEPLSTICLGKKLTIEFNWHANSRRYLPEFVVLQYLILDFSATNGWVISVL